MARPRWQEHWGRPVTWSEGNKGRIRKEGEDTKKKWARWNCGSAENPLTWGESPGDGPCQSKEAEDLRASPLKWTNPNNREKNKVFRKEQSVEKLLDKNTKLSKVSFIKVPEETMELEIFFLKKLTEENAISLEKGHTFMLFECCKLRPWKITADVSVITTAIPCEHTPGWAGWLWMFPIKEGVEKVTGSSPKV